MKNSCQFKMQLLRSAVVFFFLSFALNNANSQPEDSGFRFLGQQTPGTRPEVFRLKTSEGTFAAERLIISEDGRELLFSEIGGYYPTKGDRILRYNYLNGSWKGPAEVFKGYGPSLSATGDTMFLERSDPETGYSIYISVRTKKGWGKPQRILKSIDGAHYYQKTLSGKQYLSAKITDGVGSNDWCILSVSGNDTIPASLGKPLNTVLDNLDYYISGDESFMILTNRPALAVSFRMLNGNWSKPQSLGRAINFGLGSWGPWVTPDRKYLFYTTGTKPDYSDVSVYWVRIDNLLDSLKNNCPDLLETVEKTP